MELRYILNEFHTAGRASLQCPCMQAFVFADVFTVQNGLKQEDASILSLFLFNFLSDYTIRNIRQDWS
jgi:hypothetical protein